MDINYNTVDVNTTNVHTHELEQLRRALEDAILKLSSIVIVKTAMTPISDTQT